MNGKSLAAFAAAIVAAVILVLVWSTPHYGEVSEKAYQFATASYGACMARNPERVAKLEALLSNEDFRNELSNQEVVWCEDFERRAE